MPKEKINVVVDGITYKNIDVYNWNGKYDISTTGVAQIIKQFVKNNYGDIKVWGKSDSYSGGSSVNIYLWKVPEEWYEKVDKFADRFGMYNEYDGGDGYWRGKSVGAYDEKGNPIGNSSPYMHVYNKPPYGAKEEDMTPPNYEEQPKPKKKEFERKGAKFSPTDNLDLILDCGNGWKIYVGKPKEKYLYNVVKDKDTKQNKEQWAEIKADMLEAGFMWGYKSGTFQRWTTTPDDTLPQQACNVLSKYWGGSSQPKKEIPNEDSEVVILFKEGDRIILTQDDIRTSALKEGMKGTILYDIYEGMDYSDVVFDDLGESRLVKTNIIKKIENEEVPNEEPKEVLPFYLGDIVNLKMPFLYNNVLWGHGYKGKINSIDYGDEIAYVDFLDNEDNVRKIPVPFSYLEKYVNNEETPREFTGKIPLVKIIDVWGNFGKPNREFTNYEDLEKEFSQMEVPESGYDKYKFKFEWADGSFIIDRIDVGQSGSDFNPTVKTFEEYIKDLYTTNMETITVFYEYEMKESMSKYSTEFRAELPKGNKIFKVGDKVRLIKDIDKTYYPNNQELELGDIGIVKNNEGGLGIYFDVEFNGKEIYLDSSYFELVQDEMPKQVVDLDTYISDLNMLLEMEQDADKRIELSVYLNDLNTLKLLE